jgi:signal transduction histidine kinase/ligand-binding sensor domain-containing protein
LVVLLIAAQVSNGKAEDRKTPLKELEHTAWTSRQGAPRNITAFVEGRDGTLWMGSDVGLFNFDGSHFSQFFARSPGPQLPQSSIQALCISTYGTLWIGFASGEVVSIHGNGINTFDQRSGLPGTVISQIIEGEDNSLWAIAGNRLMHLRSGQWDGALGRASFGSDPVHHILRDDQGVIWAATGTSVWFLPPGFHQFQKTSEAGGSVESLVEAKDNSLWMLTMGSNAQFTEIRQLNVPGHPVENPRRSWPIDTTFKNPSNSGRFIGTSREIKLFQRNANAEHPSLLSSSDGSLWYSMSEGVSRVGNLETSAKDVSWLSCHMEHCIVAGKSNTIEERFREKDGLSGTSVHWMLQDRFGDVWTATPDGIDRFVDPKLRRSAVPSLTGKNMLSVGRNGQMWFGGTTSMPLSSVQNGIAKEYGPKRIFFNLFCDAEGAVWFSDIEGFWRYRSGAAERMPLPAGIFPEELGQIAGLSQKSLFVVIHGKGLWHFNGRRWAQLETEKAPQGNPLSLYESLGDDLWVGYADGSISELDLLTGARRNSHPALSIGRIAAFSRRGPDLLVGGQSGLGECRLSHCFPLLLREQMASHNITGMVTAKNGDLWLNTPRGIVLIDAGELNSAIANPQYRMQFRTVSSDGASVHLSEAQFPTAAMDTSGTLWFSTESAVLYVDPETLSFNSAPPVLARLSATVDGQPLLSGGRIRNGMHTIRLAYLGSYLPAPEQIRYRYKLEGLDRDWHEAGTDTVATYTNLHPGRYLFHVMVSTGEGVSTVSGKTIEFIIVSALYQRAWFLLLCGVILILVAWTFIVIRTRRLAAVIKLREEHRTEERVRIARDLHDTLLQGIQGLMLRFHVAALAVPEDSPARSKLESALVTADRIMLEGRDRVNRLRSDMLINISFPDAFQTVGAELNAQETVYFRVESIGDSIDVCPAVFEELFCIGREAITNAFRHSRAKEIHVAVEFTPAFLRIECRDNGIGINPSQSTVGHWGLVGIRERAEKISAVLDISSVEGQGTRISVTVCATAAYGKAFVLRHLVSSGISRFRRQKR